MLGRIIRVLFGFAMCSIAPGLTLVLFVTTPVELATLPSDTMTDALTANGLLALAAGTHSAVFAAPFALIGTAIGELRGIASWLYYVMVGIIIAGIGFLAQFWSESGGQVSIVNNYALVAFLTTGFVAGMVYWLFAGQFAAVDDEPKTPEIIKPPRPAPSTEATKPMPRAMPSKP
jgi:hypothetical protein